MKRLLLIWALLTLLPALAEGQARTHITTSGILPTHCTVGDIYIKTGTSLAFHYCLVTDVWTRLADTLNGCDTSGTCATATTLVMGGDAGKPAFDVSTTNEGSMFTIDTYSGAGTHLFGCPNLACASSSVLAMSDTALLQATTSVTLNGSGAVMSVTPTTFLSQGNAPVGADFGWTEAHIGAGSQGELTISSCQACAGTEHEARLLMGTDVTSSGNKQFVGTYAGGTNVAWAGPDPSAASPSKDSVFLEKNDGSVRVELKLGAGAGFVTTAGAQLNANMDATAYSVAGTAGHTGGTCSAWVSGLCTAP